MEDWKRKCKTKIILDPCKSVLWGQIVYPFKRLTWGQIGFRRKLSVGDLIGGPKFIEDQIYKENEIEIWNVPGCGV